MPKLNPYQKEGVQLNEKFDGRFLLADEQGLGKTIQVLEYLRRNPKMRPAIIVCPASVKYVWQDQAREHCGLRTTICSGQKPPKKTLLHNRDIFVINYDILFYWANYLRKLHPQFVALDEGHRIKSRGALRTRAARMLCAPLRKIPISQVHLANKAHLLREDEAVWFEDTDGTRIDGFVSSLGKDGRVVIRTQVPHLGVLSGTPLTNRPAELWSVLNLIWPQFFPAFTPYAWEYCAPEMTPYGWQYKGAPNLDKLHRMLTRIGMIRRRKKDVLKDLPKKRRFVVPLDLGDRKEYEAAKGDFINWLHRQDASKAERASKAEKITQMAYLKRLAAMGKLKGVFDWVDSFLEESDDKLLIGCMHHSVIDAIHQRYKSISLTFSGKTADKDRSRVIHAFRKDPRKRIIIGQIQAIGTGVDGLQSVACTSAVVELPWDPGTMGQFDDRIHRIGQKRNVSIYYLVAKGTLEESLCKLLQDKQEVLTRTLDGEDHVKGMSIDIYDRLERELLRTKK